MSTPTYSQGKLVPLMISTDDITYKSIVCKTTSGADITVPNNITQTDCGPAVGTGVPGLTMTFSGLLNKTPNGATEASYDDILLYINNQTLVYLKCQPGNKIIKGYGYITDMQVTNPTDNLVNFTFTFTSNGSATIS